MTEVALILYAFTQVFLHLRESVEVTILGIPILTITLDKTLLLLLKACILFAWAAQAALVFALDFKLWNVRSQKREKDVIPETNHFTELDRSPGATSMRQKSLNMQWTSLVCTSGYFWTVIFRTGLLVIAIHIGESAAIVAAAYLVLGSVLLITEGFLDIIGRSNHAGLGNNVLRIFLPLFMTARELVHCITYTKGKEGHDKYVEGSEITVHGSLRRTFLVDSETFTERSIYLNPDGSLVSLSVSDSRAWEAIRRRIEKLQDLSQATRPGSTTTSTVLWTTWVASTNLVEANRLGITSFGDALAVLAASGALVFALTAAFMSISPIVTVREQPVMEAGSVCSVKTRKGLYTLSLDAEGYMVIDGPVHELP